MPNPWDVVKWLCEKKLFELAVAVVVLTVGGVFLFFWHDLSSGHELLHHYHSFLLFFVVIGGVTLSYVIRGIYGLVQYNRRNKSLPEDTLVVAILDLCPNDASDAECRKEAVNFPDRIEEKLRKRNEGDVEIKIRRRKKAIKGEDEEECKSAAKAIGRKSNLNVHLVVWGSVRMDRGELCYRMWVTVAQESKEGPISEDYYSCEGPDNLDFTKETADKIGDIVTFLYGYALFEAKIWDKAIAVLAAVSTPEALFCGAEAYYKRANVLEKPRLDLQESIACYREALTVRTRDALPQDWAGTQNNLGVALMNLGERSSGEESAQYFQEAVICYREALEVRTREALPQDWATTQNNLGVALRNLGERSSGEESARYFQEAVACYREALEVRTREALPQNWAGTQNNLGVALQNLGERSSGEESARYFQEAVACYREALEVRTREALPQNWATTQNNLGNVLSSLGERSSGEESARYFQEAVACYREALKVYTCEALPQEWAMTQNNLGGALSRLGERSSGEESARYFQEAVACFDGAIEVFGEESYYGQIATENRTLALEARQRILDELSQSSPEQQP